MQYKRKRHVLYRVISVTSALILVFSLCILPFSASASTLPGYTISNEFQPLEFWHVYWNGLTADHSYGYTGDTSTSSQFGFNTTFRKYYFTDSNQILLPESVLHFKYELSGNNFKKFDDNYLRIDFLLITDYVNNGAMDKIRFKIGGVYYLVGGSDGVVTYAGSGTFSGSSSYTRVGFLIDLDKLSGYGSQVIVEIGSSASNPSYLSVARQWSIWASPLVYFGYSEKSVAEEEIYQGPDTGTVDELEQQESALRDQVDDNKQEFTNLINVPWSSLTGLKSGLLAIGNVFDSAFLRMPWLNNIFSISIAVGLCALILSLLAITFRKGGK